MSDYVSLIDRTGSVAPGDIVISGGIVQRVVIHSPGHRSIVIRTDFYALEILTTRGTRWVGGTTAYIGSDLRAHWSR